MGGRPCVRGLRFTVYDVASYLASGMSEEEILRDFPCLEKEDFLAVYEFLASMPERTTLNIPDSVLDALRISEGEAAQRLWRELAITLYAQGALSLGKSAELAGVSRLVFGEMIGQRGIARHYSEADLAQDLSHARDE